MENRIIKFLAWDDNNKKFDYFPNKKSDVIEIGRGIEYQQFTGLKDKNGKEIFEGDIIELYIPGIKVQPTKFISSVKFFESIFSVATINKDYLLLRDAIIIANKLNKGVKIIGNIFENKNLIEK